MNFRFLVAAHYELDEAYEWYEDQDQMLGGKFIAEIQVALRRIMVFPESCEEISAGIRKCLVRRFPTCSYIRLKSLK